ncbi:MAG TPA: selenoneine biosynthesis selenosugar synthase SenB [Ramlibacter sp.]|nr:selenoneine biosynthesis selenosugar synthase SenB [Ramlibacter sp.]
MGSTVEPVVCIVTPGTRTANNGNWRTAARWAAMLRGQCKVIVQTAWQGERCDLMIALHARRSAPSITAYRAADPRAPLAVVLTGTDLYHDLPESFEATQSLDVADRIVLLQDDARRYLKPAWRRKAEVILQSARVLKKTRQRFDKLRVVVVGHLRPEKDPATLFAAVQQLPRDLQISIRHIGAPLDDSLARQARELARREVRYRYHGALAHGLTRDAIRNAHLLVHPSVMEGGANVIVEAVTAGTPVLASRMSGNVGMLGARYPGYFEVGDASALAACLVRAREDAPYLQTLRDACSARRKLFTPAAEQRAVRGLVREMLARPRR